MRAPILRRVLQSRLYLQLLQRSFADTAAPRLLRDEAGEPRRPEHEQQLQPLTPQLQTDTPSRQQTQIPTPPPLIYPPSPSPHHSDLPSFLAYASRVDLDPTSNVYVGTHFEYTVLTSLARYGFSLRRVGGVSDCGIDLLGTWSLPLPPSASSPSDLPQAPTLRILVQCKAVQRPGPHLIRELEGAFVGAPAGWRGRAGGVLGLLVTERAATKGIRDALGRSGWPMGFVACSREGKVEQMLWNRRAEEEGWEGLGVGTRFNGDGGREVGLVWRGRNLPLLGG